MSFTIILKLTRNIVVNNEKLIMTQSIKSLSRQILVGFLCIIVTLLFSDCAGTKGKVNYKNPKSVTIAFYRALAEMDLEKAKELGTEETQKVMVLLQTFNDAYPEDKKEAEKAKASEVLKLLKKAKCEVADDVARCMICCDEAGVFGEEVLVLNKVNKKWLVVMTKDGLQK
jgi:hypothetical protein